MAEPKDADRVATQRVSTDRLGVPGRGSRVLVVLSGEPFVHHPLPAAGEVTVGRASWCDVRIDHPSLSRTHFVLVLGERVTVRDLGSVNGTSVRGEKLASQASAEVAPNESFVAGDIPLVVQERRLGAAEPEPARAPAAAGLVPDAEPPKPRAKSSDRPAEPSRAPGRSSPIVASTSMMNLVDLAKRVAAGGISVLVVGETGAGKEMLTSLIHSASPRSSGPYVRINCAAIHDSLFESELFGHTKGAFTGAVEAKRGLIEAATGGTLLLDEVGELSPSMQAKLLRVLEDRSVLRVGATNAIPIDVRFVAATNRDLEVEATRGLFRRDLYYRLAGVVLEVPPLREREEDIEPLAEAFLAEAAARVNRPVPAMAASARAALHAHDFPGNVRELRNAMERALLLCRDAAIEAEHLGFGREGVKKSRPIDALEVPTSAQAAPQAPSPSPVPPARADASVGGEGLADELQRIERQRILDALETCAGNQTRAAELLGMPRRTLVKRLVQYGVKRPRSR